MELRIIKKDNKFYPQYFCSGIFGLFKGWRFYDDEELLLNGIYTTTLKCNLSFSNLKDAIEFLEIKPK